MGNFEKGSVESTHKVPTSHYHTKHCHAAVNFYMKIIPTVTSFFIEADWQRSEM